jgi:ABC-type phosphate transport system substrate-binding protein
VSAPAAAPSGESGPKEWAISGRPLPAPELLRPTLDPDLPAYGPRTRVDGTLRGTATDVLPFLVARWAESFRQFHPNVRLDVPPPYGGGPGAKRLIERDADFSLQSRELRPVDLAAFREAFGRDPLLIPVGAGSWRHHGFLDALTVIVHASNPLERIDYTQLDALFSRTRLRGAAPIRTWDELGVGGDRRGAPIHVWAPRPWNGYEEFVRQRVLSVGSERGEWRDDLHFAELVIPIAGHVAADPLALGYTGMAFLADGVRSVAIAETADGPYLAPTQEAVARGTYPFSRVFYLVADRAPGSPLSAPVAELTRFILSREGQRDVLEHGVFNPLRADAARRSLALLD